jgi:hypothetical protein
LDFARKHACYATHNVDFPVNPSRLHNLTLEMRPGSDSGLYKRLTVLYSF